MKKNNKGIALMTLVLTIMVIFILASIAIPTGNELVIKSKLNRFLTVMSLMKIETEKLYEDYEFDNDSQILTIDGTAEPINNINSILNLLSEDEKNLIITSGTWYKWNKDTLDYLGIDVKKIIKDENSEFFCINYETGEILFNSGIIIDNENNVRYTLTGLLDYESVE